MIRRVLIIGLVLIGIGAAGAVWLVFNTGEQGSGNAEAWIGREIEKIAASYLNPKLSFTKLDYQYPSTVSVKNLRLTAPDPRQPGKTVDVIAAGEAIITLANVPQEGGPIVFERITLYRPVLRLVQGDRGFVGLSGMTKRGSSDPSTAPSTATTKLSEVFRLRRLELIDGQIEFDPRQDGQPAMLLDQITALVELEPQANGTYRIETNLGRKPIVDSSLRGQLDVDAWRLFDLRLKVSADAGANNLQFLPPPIQEFLKQYDARGEMNMDASGEYFVLDPGRSRVNALINLASVNLNVGPYKIPLDSLTADLGWANSALSIRKVIAAVLQGEAYLDGQVQLNSNIDATLTTSFTDLKLKELLIDAGDPTTSLDGKLSGQIHVNAPLRVIAARVSADSSKAGGNRPATTQPWPANWGGGEIDVTDGQLVSVPVIRNIDDALAGATKLVRGQKPRKLRDRLKLAFELVEGRIQFSEIMFISELLAGRGKGHIAFDRAIDLTLNGGPVERVQNMLGDRVGGAFGKVTDTLSQYRVTGTVDEPKVAFEVVPGVTGGLERLGEIFRGK